MKSRSDGLALGEPYGGTLIDRVVPQRKSEEKMKEAKEMTAMRPFIDFIYDAEKIAVGAYSPLEGFMGSEAFESVTARNRLPGGLPWTIPIILAVPDSNEISQIKEGQEIALLDWNDAPFATL